MMKDYYKQVDDYITGRLTSDELIAFETALSNDLTLQKRVESCKELSDSLNEQNIVNLRYKLNTAYIGYKTGNKNYIYKWSIAVVASIILFLLIFSNLIIPINSSDLFNKYYSRFELTGVERGLGNLEETKITNLYQNGEYKELIGFLNKLKETGDLNSSMKLVLVSAYLECNQADSAEHVLLQLVNNNIDINYETIRWYLALTQLKRMNLFDSYEYCQELVAYRGKYYKQSSQLIKDLDRLIKR